MSPRLGEWMSTTPTFPSPTKLIVAAEAPRVKAIDKQSRIPVVYFFICPSADRCASRMPVGFGLNCGESGVLPARGDKKSSPGRDLVAFRSVTLDRSRYAGTPYARRKEVEGPSIHLAAEQLRPFVGRRVRRVDGNSRIGIERFNGKTVREIFAWGKHLVFQFDGFALRVHFMLWGTFAA